VVIARAKKDPKRVSFFAEADKRKILKAAQIIRDEKIGIQFYLDREENSALIEDNSWILMGFTIIDPMEEKGMLKKFCGHSFQEKEQRKGMTSSGGLAS